MQMAKTAKSSRSITTFTGGKNQIQNSDFGYILCGASCPIGAYSHLNNKRLKMTSESKKFKK